MKEFIKLALNFINKIAATFAVVRIERSVGFIV